MDLPFTKEQFFGVFAAYNTAVWPAQLLLNLLAIALVILILRAPERAGRFVSFALAAFWAWLGIAYHLAFFWTVNPAAPLFAALSLITAALFAWVGGIRGQLVFEPGIAGRAAVGLLTIMFALVIYPLISEVLGHHYPASPTFGLPCPFTLFTFGILLMAAPSLPRILVIGPLIWSLIGATAAFMLGVTQDLALIVVAVLGLYLLLRKAPDAGNSLLK
jgi:hypothetical protein